MTAAGPNHAGMKRDYEDSGRESSGQAVADCDAEMPDRHEDHEKEETEHVRSGPR
jgi:hypothetical protein